MHREKRKERERRGGGEGGGGGRERGGEVKVAHLNFTFSSASSGGS